MIDNWTSTSTRGARRSTTGRAPLAARLTARLRAARFDRLIAVGVSAPEGSALGVHYARLTSRAERTAVARSLRAAVRDARSRGPLMSSRIPMHVPNIVAAEGLIDTVARRLDSAQPVGARGVARLRALLADGSGPMYRFGRGDLTGRLGAALAEL
ncbi:hypothetical protein [Mycolicibacterium holsaticum]|jgi:hypothetical protein|uniref:hypothetical protein n=1 Tax=Mycolicibacterium holsaticum TaxID=152142 RepID=UPI001E34CA2A|nr:hypothetical protein [Mycolicibacterium holsaticum]MDA4107683.1 hypothetical protein [Mycolicibacterium holsaticum DSM 44478 = JCM 12374]